MPASVDFEEEETPASNLSDPAAMRLNKLTSNINNQAEQLQQITQRRPTVEKKMNKKERTQSQLREEEEKANKKLFEHRDDRYDY